MRIDVTLVPVSGEKPTDRPAGPKPTGGDGEGVQVVVSAGATAASEARARSEASWSQKVERLRALVDAGEYQVDLDVLAERIADDELARRGMK